MAKTKLHYTPRGRLYWPKVQANRPDTKFNPEGTYSARIILEGEAMETFKTFVDEAVDASVEKAKKELREKGGKGKAKLKTLKPHHPYEPELDEEGDETGALIFNIKRNAIGRNKKTGETWKNIPKLFDSKGRPCKVKVGSGTEAKVCFKLRDYYMASENQAGICMDLLGLQILKLVEFGEGDLGFGAAEDGEFDSDGYEYEEDEVEDDDTDVEDDDEEDDDVEDDDTEDEGEGDGPPAKKKPSLKF